MSIKITSIIEKDVVTLDEERTALDAAAIMAKMYVGSVIVKKAKRVTGLFTERDLMMKVVAAGRDPAVVKIREVMTRDLVMVGPYATCMQCIKLMKKYRCRHLAVFEKDEFLGVVSLRDMLALMIEEKEHLEHLLGEIKGYMDEPDEE
jgi:signal-transduction protein with cAMP-binding, CBS, and nucleotidyltransferase domain